MKIHFHNTVHIKIHILNAPFIREHFTRHDRDKTHVRLFLVTHASPWKLTPHKHQTTALTPVLDVIKATLTSLCCCCCCYGAAVTNSLRR